MASQLYSATRQRHAQVARLLDQLGLARVGGPTAVALVVLYVTGLIVLDARPARACPSLFDTGFADPVEAAKASRLGRALSGAFRLIFADHRGQGGSDEPREASAYALATRVCDAVAVLDA